MARRIVGARCMEISPVAYGSMTGMPEAGPELYLYSAATYLDEWLEIDRRAIAEFTANSESAPLALMREVSQHYGIARNFVAAEGSNHPLEKAWECLRKLKAPAGPKDAKLLVGSLCRA